jgi:dephospho-CoA kinase
MNDDIPPGAGAAPGEGARPRAAVIGLTGPIGCGKSTVADWLREGGAAVVDADRLARAVVEPGTPAHAAIVAAFGPAVVVADGSLDRAELGRRVFADPAELHRLEAIVHPAVRPAILAALEAARAGGATLVVLEAIRLVEGGYAPLCDEVWLVTCDPVSQRERLAARGLDAVDAERRIAAQADLPARVATVPHRVVDTTGRPDEVRPVVERLAAAAVAMVASRALDGE